MGADDVKGKPYQKGNDNERRNQKGRSNPHRDAHARFPSQR
jgi:hypothetical protein